MNIFTILFIVFISLLILTIISSFFCFFATILRIKKFKFPEFSLKIVSPYRVKNEKIIKNQKLFEKQKFEELKIKRNKRVLVADLLKSDNSSKFIIFMHGYRCSCKEDFSPMLSFYKQLNYNLLFVHQRAHGKSEGRHITFGIKERYDCKKWIDELIKIYGNKIEIVLVGMSMGASTVLMTSKLELPKNVKTIIADCGYTSPWLIIKNTIKQLHLPVYPIIWFINFYSILFCKINLKKRNTIEAMKKTDLPILFIHGTADRFVPCYMSEDNYEAKKSKKQLLLIKGAKHGECFLKDSKTYKKNVKEWLEKYIKN